MLHLLSSDPEVLTVKAEGNEGPLWVLSASLFVESCFVVEGGASTPLTSLG